MFLNLSNHPSEEWGPAQLEAARRIAWPILDEPFPVVPPEADERYVAEVGRELLERVLGLGPRAALVQGEFTLTCYLVHRLEAAGIPCFAGTTLRGERFGFVRFRRYT